MDILTTLCKRSANKEEATLDSFKINLRARKRKTPSQQSEERTKIYPSFTDKKKFKLWKAKNFFKGR